MQLAKIILLLALIYNPSLPKEITRRHSYTDPSYTKVINKRNIPDEVMKNFTMEIKSGMETINKWGCGKACRQQRNLLKVLAESRNVKLEKDKKKKKKKKGKGGANIKAKDEMKRIYKFFGMRYK